MTDRQLADLMWAELAKTTDPYPVWKSKGFPAPTHWSKAKAFGDQIGVGVVPVFGAKIPQPFPEITGPSGYLCRTWAELDTVRQKQGPKAICLRGMIPVPVNVDLNADTKIFGVDRTQDGITGGRFVCDAQRIRIRNLGITKSVYDGVKIGDNHAASQVDIDGCWIRDVGEQGVLIANQGATDVWVRNTTMERLGQSTPNDARIGHGVYVGGPTARVVVQKTKIYPTAFGSQAYPGPTDVLYTQNTIEGGTTRGGFQASGSSRNVRFVGNVIVGSKTAAFEIGAASGAIVEDNLAWQCAHGMWEPGYWQGPGANNQVADPAFRAKGFIRSQSFDWVLSANAGAA